MVVIAPEAQGLLPDLLRQITQATGWRLQYPAPGRPADQIASQLESDTSCCWHRPLDDGSRPAGFLHLEPPVSGDDRASFLEATGLAEVLADLLSRLAAA